MNVKSKPELGESPEQLAKKYGIDILRLKKEQEKFARQIDAKDSIDFSRTVKIGGISNIFLQNRIISGIVVLNSDLEIIEQKYFSDRTRFPYIPGFRAYRELPAMISCFSKLEEKPEVMFVPGHGIAHGGLGIASHFSLATGVPTIGVADSLNVGEVVGEDIVYDGKKIGKIVQTKKGSNPLYVSPGNLISIKSSAQLTKNFVKEPHKMPEPIRLAHKYVKQVMEEIFKTEK